MIPDSDWESDNGMTKRMIKAGRAVYKVEFVAFAESHNVPTRRSVDAPVRLAA